MDDIENKTEDTQVATSSLTEGSEEQATEKVVDELATKALVVGEGEIETAVHSWLRTHVANSPVSQNTDAWNHITSVLPYLVSGIKAIAKVF